jgi:hypothetical protein
MNGRIVVGICDGEVDIRGAGTHCEAACERCHNVYPSARLLAIIDELEEKLRAYPASDASHAMLQVQRDTATKAWQTEAALNKRLTAVLVRLHDATSAYFLHNGAEHETEDCPEDDTCECPLVNAVNEAFAAALPVVESL